MTTNEPHNRRTHSDQVSDSLSEVLHLDGVNIHGLPTNGSSTTPTFTSDLLGSSPIADKSSSPWAYEGLLRKVWLPAPNIPINFIKYAIGRRELSMKTRLDQTFDLVEPDPYSYPPMHTVRTQRLKAWQKLVSRSPACLSKTSDESPWPKVKLAFGPLGWDQVWGYEYITADRVLRNSHCKEWWMRMSYDHFLWCAMYRHIEFYGIEMRFPYGYDTTTAGVAAGTSTNRSSPIKEDRSIRIPANENVIVPLGRAITEWAKQVRLLYTHCDDGPAIPYSFIPNERNQQPFQITMRFKNTHPDALTPSPTSPSLCRSLEEKGNWNPLFLTTEELTILSGEVDNTEPSNHSPYLTALLSNGGPRPNPKLSNSTNRHNMLQFWDLEGKCDDVVEYFVSMRWVWERFQVDVAQRGREGEDVLRRGITGRVLESLRRAERDAPF